MTYDLLTFKRDLYRAKWTTMPKLFGCTHTDPVECSLWWTVIIVQRKLQSALQLCPSACLSTYC